MFTITLDRDIADKVSRLAETTNETPDMLVDKALRVYLDEIEREQLRAERRAFDSQKEELLVKYRGDYVAVHEGNVIDHDPNLRALHLRVFAKLGHTPVLLKRVTDEPDRVLVFRSPKIVRGEP